MLEDFKAYKNKILIKETDQDIDKSLIIKFASDKKRTYIRGIIISVGDEIEHLKEGDEVIFTSMSTKLKTSLIEGNDDGIYVVEEDAVYCKIKN